MSYDPQTERTVLIGIEYKEQAKENAKQDKRTLRGYLEYLIDADTTIRQNTTNKVLT